MPPSMNASLDACARVYIALMPLPPFPLPLSLSSPFFDVDVRATCTCHVSAQARDRLQAVTSRANITSTPLVVVVGGCGGVRSLLSLSPSLALSLQERVRVHIGIAAHSLCLPLRPLLRGCTRIRHRNQHLTRVHAEKQRQTRVCGAAPPIRSRTHVHLLPSCVAAGIPSRTAHCVCQPRWLGHRRVHRLACRPARRGHR